MYRSFARVDVLIESIFVVSEALAVARAWQCSFAVCRRSARDEVQELSVSCSIPRYLIGGDRIWDPSIGVDVHEWSRGFCGF